MICFSKEKVKPYVIKAASGFLSAALFVSFIPNMFENSTVLADEIKNQDNTYLGVSGISNPDAPEADKPWSGNYVYFGKYEKNPIKFRVLQKNTDNGFPVMLLDSDVCLFTSDIDRESSQWGRSELRTYLNGEFLNRTFNEVERNYLTNCMFGSSTLFTSGSYEEWAFKSTVSCTDRVFLLDTADVLNPAFGYSADAGWTKKSGVWDYSDIENHTVTNHIKEGSRNGWLLRSNGGGRVENDGTLHTNGTWEAGVAPAICLNHDNVLFSTSLASNEKEFKLTLYDSRIKIKTSWKGWFNDKGEVQFTYEISDELDDYYAHSPAGAPQPETGVATRVSVLILDKEYSFRNENNSRILFYDELNGTFERNGKGTFKIPDSLDLKDWGSGYHVYIIAEDINGEKETDFASYPVELYPPADGWCIGADNQYYYYDIVSKSLKKGWFDIDGYTYYLDPSTGAMKTGWHQIDNIWYYFRSYGAMATDWQYTGNGWYYFGDNGHLHTGWQKIEGKWYYFVSTGAMQTGWQKIDGAWYFFNSSGVMSTDWKKIDGIWYYFGSNGKMATGWKEINGVYYFFKSDGTMAENEYCGGYWLDAGGAWTYKYKASWKKDSKGWWYGDDSGWYAKNRTLKIDGKNYNFDTSGYCTNPNGD